MFDLVQFLATCDDLMPVIKFVDGILILIQIGIPIILIIMGSIDLGKAVLSSDDKEIKAATGKLVKRAIAAVAVFFVATIVSIVMGLFTGTGVDGTTSWSTCWANRNKSTNNQQG